MRRKQKRKISEPERAAMTRPQSKQKSKIPEPEKAAKPPMSGKRKSKTLDLERKAGLAKNGKQKRKNSEAEKAAKAPVQGKQKQRAVSPMSGKQKQKIPERQREGVEAVGGKAKGMRAPLQRAIRRQVAQVLKTVLHGDERRKSQASIKSLIYEPSIVAKKATLALTCRCLKCKDERVCHRSAILAMGHYLAWRGVSVLNYSDFPVLKEIVAATDLLSGKKKIPVELLYVMTCDMLFGQEELSSGALEDAVLKRKSSLQAALSRLLVKKNVMSVEELVAPDLLTPEAAIPRYVRVNTLKMNLEEAVHNLQQIVSSVERDGLIQDLLILPAGTDLHKHPLVLNGSLLLQGKASCMPALVLAPQSGWEVIDACAAPGNKTVHLAALMHGTGKIYACEINSTRVERLQETIKLAGASNVDVFNDDFLKLDPSAPQFSKVQGILLDPSCSGSGTAQQRLDHLLPSSIRGNMDSQPELWRLEQLAQFQERALRHALSFPSVQRVVYSTCSVHQRENEDVVSATLSHASSLGFQLATAIPEWQHRGLPVFDGAHHLVRTDSARDHMDGFFVALFVRGNEAQNGPCSEVSGAPATVGQSIVLSSNSEDHISQEKGMQDKTIKPSVAEISSKLRRRKLKRKRKRELQVAAAHGQTKKAVDPV